MNEEALPGVDREFLTLIAKAAFANPFGNERAKLDLEIAGLPEGATHETCLDVALERVRAFLLKLDNQGRNHVNAFAARDRPLLTTAYLFDIFHQYILSFDNLIQRQITAGDALCPVPFGKDVANNLISRGIEKPDALRFLAMFYQLRRAYYFIDCALIGRSASMRNLRRSLWNNVFTHDMRIYERFMWTQMEDFSTLLLGETGTGKGAAATAIGRSGFIPFDDRRQCFVESFMRSFLSMNLSQFSESLIESELFGHKKGAFTGAVEMHEGVFARCSPHGAIFLDEIGDTSIPVQIKLLQVLQERVFSPVGSHEKRRFNGRFIAATNRPLDTLRAQGSFRNDFFYRLCSDVITVPPLRLRLAEDPAELDDLLRFTVKRIVGTDSPEIVQSVHTVITRELGDHYPWPGNVRELEQAVRRTILTHTYEGDRPATTPDLRTRLFEGIDSGAYRADHLVADYCALLHSRHGTYEEVARRTGLDRRTARKYVLTGQKQTD